jgi:cation-transporting ATPase E
LQKNQITNPKTGLSSGEAAWRAANGLENRDASLKPKPISRIVKDNFFTLFNAINFALTVMILFTGSFRNLLFMIVVICNSLISLFHELRARNATERLKLISSKNIQVLRDSKIINIKTELVVRNDIVIFESGDQIIADCVVVSGTCEADESLLTGESDLVEKKEGDSLFAGSFIVSGKVYACAVKVGKNTYSAKISRRLKNIKSAQSEIMLAVKKIIKIVSIAIIPIGVPFFINQFKTGGFVYASAALTTGAALIGMIPEGLALLTSSVLALGATRLAGKKILAKDVYSVEALARIDTLCLDKTGTITEGTFEVSAAICTKKIEFDMAKIIKYLQNTNKNVNDNEMGNKKSDSLFSKFKSKFKLNGSKKNKFSAKDEKKYFYFADAPLIEALKILASSFENGNETLKALQRAVQFQKNKINTVSVVPFSSQRKFSGVYLGEQGSVLMGSAEVIFGEKSMAGGLAAKFSDYRVLAVGRTKEKITRDYIPKDAKFLGVILLTDKIRKNARETIKYFKENDVEIKVISGDGTAAVSKIANLVGIPNAQSAINARKLNSFSKISEASQKYTVFGRVTPEKKREIIKALKMKGRCVAMTGDGVNDILALKEADCSIAMASGSSAAREISHLILMNSDFSSIPKAVFEGRRAINNIQTASSLFLVKTIYSVILAVLLLFFSVPYPFMPIQMSLISTLTVGIPSFLLALESNTARIKESIFSNIMHVSLPAALAICANIIFCFLVRSWLKIPQDIYSSIAVATTGILSIQLLRQVSLPFNFFRGAVFWFVVSAFAVCFIFYGNIFLIVSPIFWGIKYILTAFVLGVISSFLYKIIR